MDVHQNYFAHSLPEDPPEKWHPLDLHLKNVADLSEKFAQGFHSGQWAYPAGLWHDLGKFTQAFQDKLQHNPTARVDHSTAGALYAVRQFDLAGRMKDLIRCQKKFMVTASPKDLLSNGNS